ncbi:MAG: LysM peptidoglycan-binding domain-containing protein [Bacteroidales bacterium]|nr:LysM peptidoglycan-binding domain-containing protein [Bacteroidales bacterium]
MPRITAKKLLCVCAFLMSFFVGIASAQGTKTVAVKVSDKTQTINNKEYYVHIVEQGQTLFSIARAYGLKYYDAVIKTDIHLMKVGDTVWLPKNDQSVAAVVANAQAVTAPANRVHYIKIEPGQTLYGLSREYGVTVDQIVEANPELKTEQLRAGQMLKIPPKGEVEAESGKRKALRLNSRLNRRLARKRLVLRLNRRHARKRPVLRLSRRPARKRLALRLNRRHARKRRVLRLPKRRQRKLRRLML